MKCACVKRNEALNDIKSDERIVICDVEKHKDIEERLDELQEKMSFVLLPDVPHLRKRLPTSSDLMQRSRKAIGRVKIFLWNVAA